MPPFPSSLSLPAAFPCFFAVSLSLNSYYLPLFFWPSSSIAFSSRQFIYFFSRHCFLSFVSQLNSFFLLFPETSVSHSNIISFLWFKFQNQTSLAPSPPPISFIPPFYHLIIFIIGAADIMNSSRVLVRDGGIDHHVAADGMSRTVPGQAVAPSTRVNKSRCDRKCRFPSVGGLHRSSHDSSVSTASTTFPIWCHVDKSKSPSSTRTRVATFAYISKWNHPKRSTSHRRQPCPSCRCTWIDCITRMILSYATFAFPELELLLLSDLAILLCLIRRNHIAYRLGANQTTRFILSPATLKPV